MPVAAGSFDRVLLSLVLHQLRHPEFAVAEAFRNIKSFKTDVSCSPWYYGPGDEHNAVHAGSVAEIKDGDFVTRKSCFQAVDPDLAGIVKMEKDLHLAD